MQETQGEKHGSSIKHTLRETMELYYIHKNKAANLWAKIVKKKGRYPVKENASLF